MRRKSAGSLRYFCLAGAACLASLAPGSVMACAACYGQSDSPMAAGMNWGIVTLLGVIVGVLGGIAACFILLARRLSRLSGATTEAALQASAQAAWPVVEQTASLSTDRGGFNKMSTLAEKRKRCGPARTLAGAAAAPRRRR